ncbi:MAG: PAS domain S-box protein [Bacteroidales bacterium]|nr:PAS domain S-box protein [Bacteroidales bacterium]
MADKNNNQISRPHWYSSDLPPSLQTAVWISVFIVFALSILDLAGWIFDLTFLKSILAKWIPMKIITAYCFIFTATALVIIKVNAPVIIKQIIPGVVAILVSLVSLATLYVCLYHISTGHESSLAEVSYLTFCFAPESRMSFFEACIFFIIGNIVFLLMADKTKTSNLAHVLIIPIALISYFIPASYLLGVYSVTELIHMSVALTTGIAFCGICTVVLLIKPDTWFLKVFTARDTGGIIARKLLLPLMILPVVIAWLRINGERTGMFKSNEGIVLVALTYTCCFLALIWLTARSVNKIDLKRHASEEALKKSYARLELLSETANRLLVSKNPQELVNELCNRVMKFLDCQFFFNFIVDDTVRKLHLNTYAGISVKSAQKIEWLDFGVADCGYIVLDGNRIVAKNFSDTSDPRTDLIRSFGIKAYARHPLLSRDKVIGTLSFGSSTQISFSEEDLSMMKIVTDQVAIAISRIRNENALRESEERFKAMAEVSPVGMGVVEFASGKFLYINPSYEQYFGYDKDELLSKKAPEIFLDTKDKELIYKKLEEDNFVSNYEVKLKRKDGSSFWSMSSIRPIKFINKPALLETFIDITDHKRAEKELQSTKDYLENLINYANAPIIVWNPDTRIQLFNHAFEHLTGYSSSEVEGKMLDVLFPKASLKESNAKIKDALTENWKTIEIPILTKNKEIRTVLWNSANIYDTDRKTVLSTIAQGNDITERIDAEQKVKERTKDLELANLQLKQELTERFQAQQALRKSEIQLKELNATKDKFFNIVAHDLKNPFTSLLGSSELLSKNIDQLDNEKIQNLATILNDSAKSGYAILQNLLDWSRSQTGMLKFNPERINLRKLIDENILNQELFSTNKEIELYSEVKEDIFIFADKNMINTVLRNILSNALKFTYRYGKVVVSALIDSDDAIISVKDNGIGISKENIDKLFRIDTKYSMPGTNNEQGTGLGLKLSREFVEKHGGRIWVESIEFQGSEFTFSIPQMKDNHLMK